MISNRINFATDFIGKMGVRQINALLRDIEPLYGFETWRETTPGSPHTDTQSIYLRMPPTITPDTVFNSLEVVDRPVMRMPIVQMTLDRIQFLSMAKGVARALIARLKPGGSIPKHVDEGVYAQATDRYHLVLETNAGVAMGVEEEVFYPQTGELWWINKSLPHWVRNQGDTPRVHLIVDMWKD